MQETESSGMKIVLIVIGVVLAIFCCCLVLGVTGVVWFAQHADEIIDEVNVELEDGNTWLPTESETETPAAPIIVESPPAEEVPTDTLETLLAATVPENNPYDLACRLEGICGIPNTITAKNYQVGDKDQFWILNSDTVEYREITAELIYATPHSYFWAEEGTRVDKDDVKALMDVFEEEIYPTNREFFGSEWSPGVDDDPHIYIFYAYGLGSNIAGYYNSSDEFNPAIDEHSNGHESFVISSSQRVTDSYTYGVLAHEFVHMIQFASDRNDVSWMAEGFAELGVFLNGYYEGYADYRYAQNPDLQLNDWADNTSPDFSAHYGQSFLYIAYILERFGAEATQAINISPENDLQSIDGAFEALKITDPQTGNIVTADDVFIDWAVSMHLLDETVGDGRYTYYQYQNAPQTAATESIYDCPQPAQNRSVHQYGIDYISIQCAGDHTIHFNGATQTGLLPTDAYSGEYAFWSNKGDESDMTLTRTFDFSNIAAPITLSFQTWYDIEEDWDYLYLEVSTDGETWEILKTPSGTDYNPSGGSYGWAYTGKSGMWVREDVDLSAYAGEEIQVRFEYVTDAAINGEGMLIDDIRVEAADYFSDLESDDGGWEAAGFVRVQNILPQTFKLALILRGAETTVQVIELSADQTAEIPISLGAEYDEAILVIGGTTRFTRGEAAYAIEIK